MRGDATFEVLGWDEAPYLEEPDGVSKLTRASVTKRFDGDLEGEAALEYLMAYTPDGRASFVGIERIAGQLGGRSGTFVLRHTGQFADGVARAAVEVVPGSGIGDLEGLTGSGVFAAEHDGGYRMSLDYDLG